ncbi:Fe-S cluster assembly ATPase SufC [Miniphocaeibacter halophilus]|uniref:Fe-S cluster assembly ATPase SufC n=1 Tax=Miniphocaeibacter halophilus TaxID=2931922 RepID=A0AC61MQM7_9FIRM|nr:Fe-S cluster assembly ATPase SufC [Miniphocaeibacter halophilus]QQK07244.1 Fe-S cluster assembly ATPase SufC [Miniphocaeibacter halophilus]
MKEILNVKNLKVQVEDKVILKGIDLRINSGEIHVFMGPNGAGKTTFANAIMGNPIYDISEGEIYFKDKLINDLAVDERAREGIFMSFQAPIEVPGITVENFLKTAKTAVTGETQRVMPFKRELKSSMGKLEMNPDYASRYLNVGFSGGERKKNEILQMSILNPTLAFLDETDSGLDVDAIRIVSQGINDFHSEENAIVIITHQIKLLEKIKPDFVHVFVDGEIVKSGDMSLALDIEKNGFDAYKKEVE